jgi:hypothetical protein
MRIDWRMRTFPREHAGKVEVPNKAHQISRLRKNAVPQFDPSGARLS